MEERFDVLKATAHGFVWPAGVFALKLLGASHPVLLAGNVVGAVYTFKDLPEFVYGLINGKEDQAEELAKDKEASYSCGVTLKNTTEPEMLMTANFVPSSISAINIDAVKLAKTVEKVPAKSDPIIDPQILSEIADDESLEEERITLKTKLAKLSESFGAKMAKVFKKIGTKQEEIRPSILQPALLANSDLSGDFESNVSCSLKKLFVLDITDLDNEVYFQLPPH